MNKNDLVTILSQEHGVPKNQSKKIIDFLFETLIKTLKTGKSITIRGFGTFKPIVKGKRNFLSPKTKQIIELDEKLTVKFKPSGNIKLNGEN